MHYLSNKPLEAAPWLWFFPGTLILLTVLGINFVGDGLRDAVDLEFRKTLWLSINLLSTAHHALIVVNHVVHETPWAKS